MLACAMFDESQYNMVARYCLTVHTCFQLLRVLGKFCHAVSFCVKDSCVGYLHITVSLASVTVTVHS